MKPLRWRLREPAGLRSSRWDCGSMRARCKLYANTISGTPARIFFWSRVGVVLIVLFCGYAWCRWGAGEWGFSPLIEMGKCSLLVYWVHIEFVYGGLSIVPKRSVGNWNGNHRIACNFCGDDRCWRPSATDFRSGSRKCWRCFAERSALSVILRSIALQHCEAFSPARSDSHRLNSCCDT